MVSIGWPDCAEYKRSAVGSNLFSSGDIAWYEIKDRIDTSLVLLMICILPALALILVLSHYAGSALVQFFYDRVEWSPISFESGEMSGGKFLFRMFLKCFKKKHL